MEAPDVGSAETYSQQEAAEYVRDATSADVERMNKPEELLVMWDGNNRREVFVHLLEHGWAITSMSNGAHWLERIEPLAEDRIEEHGEADPLGLNEN